MVVVLFHLIIASSSSCYYLHPAFLEKKDKYHKQKLHQLKELGDTHPMVDVGVALLHALSGYEEDSRRAHREWITGLAHIYRRG